MRFLEITYKGHSELLEDILAGNADCAVCHRVGQDV